MKRKFYVGVSILALTAIGLLYACKRTEGMEQMTTDKEMNSRPLDITVSSPQVSNSWLEFKSQEQFNNTMKILHEQYQSPEALAKWESTFTKKDFVSLRKFYEQTDADSSEKRTAPTVDSLISTNKILDCPDSWFATVLSKDGYIQIADTVYSFKPGQKNGEAFAVPARYATELIKGIAPERISGSKMHLSSFSIIPIPRWSEVGEDVQGGSSKIPICSYPSKFMPNWWGQVGGDIYGGDNGMDFPEHNGRQVKLQYHRWRVGYIFYASTGVRVKMLKHTRFAGWLSITYADYMIMEACCKGHLFIPGFPLIPFSANTFPAWPGFIRYSENNFEKTMKWVASGLANDILLDHFNFHFKVNYRDRIVERFIRQ